MARKTPTVKGNILVWRNQDQELKITVETAAWFAWLETANSFYFAGDSGTFTACKERFQRGGVYWRAHRSKAGIVLREYLGKTEALTLKQLDQVAARLAARCQAQRPNPRDPAANGRLGIGPDYAAGLISATASESSVRSASSEHWDPLLSTKLSPPLLRKELVTRSRLIARLDEGLSRNVTLLSAPAGFGKTTLLGSWCEQTDIPIAWVSLSVSENDPVRFWSYFVSALQTAIPAFGSEPLNMLRSSQPPGIEAILTALVNEVASNAQELALVLDDYHTIEAHAIHAAMAFMIDHLPRSLHLFIASRTDPPLPLVRLRAKGQLTELRAADLGFNPEETALFLNEVMRLGLSHEDLAAVEKRTEGWVVSLQLAALSLRDCADTHNFIKAFAGDNRHILDYLLEEVLRQLPEDVQTFLLRTSILDRLTGPLCEAVTGRKDGQAMLDHLEKANLFTVALDYSRRWYRYHHLFADALRTRLHRTRPDEIPELHRHACAWYDEQGMAAEAVSHALAVREFSLASDLIEKTASMLIKRGENTTIIDWIGALPDDIVDSRPRLCFLHAWSLASIGELDSAEARLKIAESCLGMNKDGTPAKSSNLESSEIAPILADIASVRATIAGYRGNAPLAVALSHQALALSTDHGAILRSVVVRNLGSAYWLSGNAVSASQMLAEAGAISQAAGYTPNAMVTLSELAGVHVVGGRLQNAAKIYRQTLQIVEEQGTYPLPGAGAPYVGMGWLLYEWNQLNAARNHLIKGISLASQDKSVVVMLPGEGALARVKQAEGDIDGALDVLQKAEMLAQSNNLNHHVVRLRTLRVRLWLEQGDLESALRWVQASGIRADEDLSYQREAQHMMLARVHIALGEFADADVLLGRLLQAAEQARRNGSVVKILTLRATAQKKLGETRKAVESLERALALAESQGYVRTFIEFGPLMATLLSDCIEARQRNTALKEDWASSGYLRSLLVASGESPGRRSDNQRGEITPPEIEPLSSRELEVLQSIAAGWSTPEIAREFVVAVSTIRTHVKNIYGKLSAHNRAQVISRARELHLLQ